MKRSSFSLIYVIVFFCFTWAIFFLNPIETKSINQHKILFSDQHQQENINATQKREFTSGETLVYVTPWNSKGYDIAKEIGWKFDYISPVWFNIIKNKKGKLSISGEHDVDKGWIEEVRQNSIKQIGKPPRIVPRFTIDHSTWTSSELSKLLIHPQSSSSSSSSSAPSPTGLARRLSAAIAQVIERHGFDGVVFEWGYIPVHQVRQGAVAFLNELKNRLSSGSGPRHNEKTLVLVIPAPRPSKEGLDRSSSLSSSLMSSAFTADDFEALSSIVDRFSLMTYDYSNPSSPGPNSPISWCRSSIEYLLQKSKNKEKDASKILMGLNFYGNHYTLPQGGPGPVLGDQFLELMEQHDDATLEWDDAAKEHRLRFKTKNSKEHLVYYPSTTSIEERIQVAREFGVGVSIWEIGQGLDIFYRSL
eukprot:gb/GECH01008480.1/.p1 GENE.gb/GECH01008480.1/~~gb/GECH01008480.1/.p1  ORF type:complete len:418 (+),score=108.15 gb/GECH01008480.1/:1-1254(+)